jgi:hypothetical protein
VQTSPQNQKPNKENIKDKKEILLYGIGKGNEIQLAKWV